MLTKGGAQDLSAVVPMTEAGEDRSPIPGVPGASVDKISMAFGIRNVPDRGKALREMHRVLRKREQSRVCILEFSLPDGSSVLSRVAQVFIRSIIPIIGKIMTGGKGGAEYRYLEKSIVDFPSPQEFAAQMSREGLLVDSVTAFAYGSVQLYTARPRL